ncbi:cupin domain-containing protein, partial [Providencia rettgeri]
MRLPELHFRQYSDEVISHHHDGQWQVVLSLSGQMEINMYRQHFLLNAGKGVVIPPSVSHALMNPLMILVKIIKLRWIHILSYDQM